MVGMQSRLRATALVAGAFVLAGCGSGSSGSIEADDAPVVDDRAVDAVAARGCPAGILSDFVSNGNDPREYDLSVIDAAVGISFPGGPSCVVAFAGDTAVSTAFYVYWTDSAEAVATSAQETLADAGFIAAPDGSSFTGAGSEVNVDAYSTGSGGSIDEFGTDEVAIAHGSFDGEPGVVASVSAKARLTWESGCMLTLDELNTAWQSTGLSFVSIGYEGESQVGCEYSTADQEHVTVDIRPYSSTARYGWVADTTWTAPDAATGAANACQAASTVNYIDELEAVCGTSGGVSTVIAADRLNALIFVPGDYFYAASVQSIGGTDALTEPLTATLDLLATRQPGAA